jgi:hypothetical protein
MSDRVKASKRKAQQDSDELRHAATVQELETIRRLYKDQRDLIRQKAQIIIALQTDNERLRQANDRLTIDKAEAELEIIELNAYLNS